MGREVDLIFVDPPYAFTEYGELLATLGEVLREGGEVAIEHSIRSQLPETVGGLGRQASRNYGDNRISFYSAVGGDLRLGQDLRK
jgi:16S rRNA G966 N2-methylase RsmD